MAVGTQNSTKARHEVAEIHDPKAPGGIGCEIRSPKPHRKVRCPPGMGAKRETAEEFRKREGEAPEPSKGPTPGKAEAEHSEPKPAESTKPGAEPTEAAHGAGKAKDVAEAGQEHAEPPRPGKPPKPGKPVGASSPVQLDPGTGVPRQLWGTPVGPAYPSFEAARASGQGSHIIEVIVHQRGKEVAQWWEVSEGTVAAGMHTEQKALSRIALDSSVEVELRGGIHPALRQRL